MGEEAERRTLSQETHWEEKLKKKEGKERQQQGELSQGKRWEGGKEDGKRRMKLGRDRKKR